MTGSEQMSIEQRTAAIRDLNDAFRRDLRDGLLHVTVGILETFNGELGALIQEVAEFDTFTNDNDPYGEHDFGSLTYMGQPVFWKIDYYGLDLKHGSPDPANPDVTTRTLTLMMPWEY
jgi:hypothetical protein